MIRVPPQYDSHSSASRCSRDLAPFNHWSESKPTYIVERVIDVDTVVLSDLGTVRLIGVDTPETVDPGDVHGKTATGDSFASNTPIRRTVTTVATAPACNARITIARGGKAQSRLRATSTIGKLRHQREGSRGRRRSRRKSTTQIRVVAMW